jgi:acyl-coenzyme A synthetase/AMP-(fatty) acid ligase
VRAHRIHFCIFPEVVYRQPPDARDADNALRRVNVYGLRKSVHADLQRRFNVQARECFGMTEIGATLYTPLEADHMVGSGTCGIPGPWRECKVVDDDGNELARGEMGELVVRGPNIFLGYYEKPDANRESFFGDWFRTGDLFVQDADGWFYLVGRKKDMVRRSGENIAAREVESVLLGIDGIEDAAVVGVPDPERGEEVKAYVVLAEGLTAQELPPERITTLTAEQLAIFKVPRYVEYVAELPRTPSMKIAKGVLKSEKADLRAGSYDRVDGVWR